MRIKNPNVNPAEIGDTCEDCKFRARNNNPSGFPPICTIFKGTIFKGIDGRGKPFLEKLPECKSISDQYKDTHQK